MQSSRQARLRQMLAARKLGGIGRSAVEAATLEALGENAELPSPADILHRVDRLMASIPADEIADPVAFKRALALVYQHAEAGISALAANPSGALSNDKLSAVEAVIRTDGSRPSLLLRDHRAPDTHPLAGDWADQFVANRSSIAHAAKATGRIEPLGGSASVFFGTGSLIGRDGADGLVLTNMHVLEAMLTRSSTLALEEDDGSYRIIEGVVIDFLGETQATEERLFNVVHAWPTPRDGDGFKRLDVALLKIRKNNDSPDFPEPLQLVADADAAGGALNSHALIGFPGRPEHVSGEYEGVDWNWVNRQLFGGRYGLKRIAPGIVHHAAGKLQDDPEKWVLGHDATSLGGNSGSPLIAWQDGGYAFAIHFAGRNVDSNFAHAFARAAARLKELGVTLTAPEG